MKSLFYVIKRFFSCCWCCRCFSPGLFLLKRQESFFFSIVGTFLCPYLLTYLVLDFLLVGCLFCVFNVSTRTIICFYNLQIRIILHLFYYTFNPLFTFIVYLGLPFMSLFWHYELYDDDTQKTIHELRKEGCIPIY